MASSATPAAILIVVGVGLIYYAVWSPKGVLAKNPVTSGLGSLPVRQPDNNGGNNSSPTSDNRERGWAVERYNAGLPAYNVTIPAGMTFEQQLSAFRNAIGSIEGGYQSHNASNHVGRYQIYEPYFRAWSKKYFGRELDWHNPVNQDAVFDARIRDYYRHYSVKFGDHAWQHIAVAWSRGPSKGRKPESEWTQHAYIYASNAMSQMQRYVSGYVR